MRPPRVHLPNLADDVVRCAAAFRPELDLVVLVVCLDLPECLAWDRSRKQRPVTADGLEYVQEVNLLLRRPVRRRPPTAGLRCRRHGADAGRCVGCGAGGMVLHRAVPPVAAGAIAVQLSAATRIVLMRICHFGRMLRPARVFRRHLMLAAAADHGGVGRVLRRLAAGGLRHRVADSCGGRLATLCFRLATSSMRVRKAFSLRVRLQMLVLLLPLLLLLLLLLLPAVQFTLLCCTHRAAYQACSWCALSITLICNLVLHGCSALPLPS
mmetsp:Transcript_37228/g.109917  ORF Transcript_37228/g.109917 Transcript_37228/m.109917 type:complete len:268 (-) Transcript_37228:283-1086(-)